MSFMLSRVPAKVPFSHTTSSGIVQGSLSGCGLLSSFCFFRDPPTTSFAMKTTLLLLQRDRRSAFHTEYLVHRLTCRHIITGEPALAVKRASVFVLTPINIFRWVCFDCACQSSILPIG